MSAATWTHRAEVAELRSARLWASLIVPYVNMAPAMRAAMLSNARTLDKIAKEARQRARLTTAEDALLRHQITKELAA